MDIANPGLNPSACDQKTKITLYLFAYEFI